MCCGLAMPGGWMNGFDALSLSFPMWTSLSGVPGSTAAIAVAALVASATAARSETPVNRRERGVVRVITGPFVGGPRSPEWVER